MKILVHGAKTLEKFTSELLSGFDSAEGNDYAFELFQIHASPNSLEEDKSILKRYIDCKGPKIILIHRPDELLLCPELKLSFEQNPQWKLIFLGDLALRDSFWKQRKSQIEVIPHFYSSLISAPKSSLYTIGTFTSWGEMRKLEHYFNLVDALKQSKQASSMQFIIGGTLDGAKLSASDIRDEAIKISEESFIPHFNVQLYHLHGKKRLGESSGSLHAGVSIPVIFEANGMERIEEVKVIKIAANDDLSQIDYASAAGEISAMIEQHGVDTHIKHNLRQARLNTSVDFANSVISMEMV
jgi:hypothetical protein